jgi:hypothetical protein
MTGPIVTGTFPLQRKRKRGCVICGSFCGVLGCRICEDRQPCSKHKDDAR